MPRISFFLMSLLPVLAVLPACGTLVRGQTQDVTLATPGATEAECVFNNGVRYKVFTGETISIMRSGSDLKVDCYASGNRYKSLVVPHGYNEWSVANIANGVVPGVTYDHLSHGLYEYPPVVTVDFTGMKNFGFELPEYHNKDAPNPYVQSIEDYSPGTPRIENDSIYMNRKVARTGMGLEGANPYSKLAPQTSNASPMTGMPNSPNMGRQSSGGFLSSPDAAWSPPAISRAQPLPSVPRGASVERLNRTMNPGVFGGNN